MIYCLAFLSLLCLYARAAIQMDDSDSSITYTGIWNHDTAQFYVANGTFSYSNDPTAQYSFTFEGTGFQVLYGTKNDRGKFLVYIDSILAGTGDGFEEGNSEGSSEATVRYSSPNLPAARHTVRIVNQRTEDDRIAIDAQFGRIGFICLDFLRIDDAPATTSVDTTSLSRALETASSSTRATTAYNSAEATTGAAQNDGDSSNVGLIAGSAGGAVGGLLILALVLFCCLRRRRKQRNALQARTALDTEMHEAPTTYDIAPVPSPAAHSISSNQALLSARPMSGYASSDAYQPDVRASLLSNNEEDLHSGRLPPAYQDASVEMSSASSSSAPAPSSLTPPLQQSPGPKGRLV